jgi:hypothetical protein
MGRECSREGKQAHYKVSPGMPDENDNFKDLGQDGKRIGGCGLK